MIYLDNNATTRVDPAVREAMLPYFAEQYGNPSSTHRFGQDARQAVEESRVQVAGLIGCDPKEIVFTSGGTESDNAAIHGILTTRAPRKIVITSTVEHSAVRTPGGPREIGRRNRKNTRRDGWRTEFARPSKPCLPTRRRRGARHHHVGQQ